MCSTVWHPSTENSLKGPCSAMSLTLSAAVKVMLSALMNSYVTSRRPSRSMLSLRTASCLLLTRQGFFGLVIKYVDAKSLRILPRQHVQQG